MAGPDAADAKRERVEVIVRGRVQGVGFRYFVIEKARALQLAGFARNRGDGTVETVAEGAHDVLLRLVEALRHGPPASRVEGLDCHWTEARGDHAGFEIKP